MGGWLEEIVISYNRGCVLKFTYLVFDRFISRYPHKHLQKQAVLIMFRLIIIILNSGCCDHLLINNKSQVDCNWTVYEVAIGGKSKKEEMAVK